MRFGRTLNNSIYPEWKDAYIDYQKLKNLLREPASPAVSPVRGGSQSPSKPGSINESIGDDEWTEEDETAFVTELINIQLKKVATFQKKIITQLQGQVTACEFKLKELEPAVAAAVNASADKNNSADPSTPTDADGLVKDKGKGLKVDTGYDDEATAWALQAAQRSLNNITSELKELEKYSRINYTGFLKATKKHDRKRGLIYQLKPLLQDKLGELSELRKDHNSLLYRLSVMYTFVRQGLAHVGHEQGADEGQGIDMADVVDPEGFTSHKFWVHPDNVLEVKTMILRELPVLVYNPQPSKSDGFVLDTYVDPSLTSIYFDTPRFKLYNAKVSKEESASSLRLRWYGLLADSPDIYLEKKTHGKIDARLHIKDKNVHPFITGQYGLEKEVRKLQERTPGTGTYGASTTSETSSAAAQGGTPATASQAPNRTPGTTDAPATPADALRQNADKLQSFISDNQLRPAMRANYRRTAYEIPRDDRVRLSLDTDLVFIREGPRETSGSWHNREIDNNRLEYPFEEVPKDIVSLFPYALLDVRVQNKYKHSRRGRWVEELMASHLVTPVYGFSKFAHGVAVLYEDDVTSLPYWLTILGTDIRRDPLKAFEEQQTIQKQNAADQLAVGSLRDVAIQSVGSAPTHPKMGVPETGVLSPAGAALRKSGEPSSLSQLSDAHRSGKATVSIVEEDGDEEDVDDSVTTGSPTSRRPNVGSSLGSVFKPLLSAYKSRKRLAERDPSEVRDARLPPGLSKPTNWIKDRGPVQVEAKVWLANQRTFIKWMHISVLLSTLSLALYNAAMSAPPNRTVDGDGKGQAMSDPYAAALAILYLSIAVFAGLWGWWLYLYRADLVRRRSGKDLSAPFGPVVVALALAGALGLNFWIKLRGIW